MNAAAILAMLSELYAQVAALRQENDALRAQLAEASTPSGPTD